MTKQEYMKLPYAKVVRWDERDSIFVARIQEIPGCVAHGTSETLALTALRYNFEAWVDDCLEAGDLIPVPTFPDSGNGTPGRFLFAARIYLTCPTCKELGLEQLKGEYDFFADQPAVGKETTFHCNNKHSFLLKVTKEMLHDYA